MQLTHEAVAALFSTPQGEAAQALGISLTALKVVCRKLGISPWPYARVKKARPPTNRASQLPCKTTVLQCCKFTSKQTQQACKGQLTIVPHKRGHLAVSCSSRHQWVWCSLCCNCHAGAKGGNINGRNRGCTVPTHWFERDAFDTGARNHMNVHKSGTTK